MTSTNPPSPTMNSTTPIDDLTFLVACKMTETMLADSTTLLSSQNSSQLQLPATSSATTTEHFVKTLQNLAMQLHVPWEHLQQRLAWEHVRQYCGGVNVPSTRHHIYLLVKRHCPDELCHLPERLLSLSSTQLLDVLVLLDEAFGGSAQAASCVGDGFREVLLRNSVLERENAELSMQLRTIRDKPKAQQNEAAFLVAELQQKLYEALGTMQTMMSTVSSASKVEKRNVGCQSVATSTSASSSSDQNQNQQQQSQNQNSNQQQQQLKTSTFSNEYYTKQISDLQKKLEESLQRELAAKQEMLTRVSQFSELTSDMSAKQLIEKNPLVNCKHVSIQTEPDAQVTRLSRERRLLLERLAAATELLKSSTVVSPSTNNSFASRRH